MDITKHNFMDLLPRIITDINEADFISMDLEFTGLAATSSGYGALFDTVEERYRKIKQGSEEFLVIQFGLCTFNVNKEKTGYVAKPYNFYTFPKLATRRSPDRRFLSQTSSIEFLSDHGFNFNKLYSEGIPYLMPKTQAMLRDEMARKHEQEKTSSCSQGKAKKTLKLSDEQKESLNNICKQIAEYLNSQDEQSLIVNPCSDMQQKQIYQILKQRFPEAHIMVRTGDEEIKRNYLEVTSAQLHQKLLEEKHNLEKIKLEQQVGFSKVIVAISKSNKLVVGHCMLLDIFHTLNNFNAALPVDLKRFKAVAKSVFPRLMDTKLMASSPPLQEHIKDTGLSSLLGTLKCPPFVPAMVELPEEFQRYHSGTGALHEAGYDALITGHCFVTMLNFWGTHVDPAIKFTSPASPLVEHLINKVFLRDMVGIQFLNLDEPEVAPDRDNILYLICRQKVETSDVKKLFKPYGKIKIHWLTKTSAYVELCDKQNSALALEALSKNVSPFQVTSFAAHTLKSTRLSAASTSAASTSAASSSTSTSTKRKLMDSEADLVPQKLQRQSVTEGVSPYPVIPEEDVSSNDSMVESYLHDSSDSEDGETVEEDKSESSE